MDTRLQERISEIQEKERRIRDWMKATGFDGVLLRQQRNFSWATAGGSNALIYGSDPGFPSVLFTGTNRYIISQQIEMPRLKEEETADLGFEYVQFDWWNEDLRDTVSRIVKGRIGCDITMPGAENVDAAVACMRPTLTRWEVERFDDLGSDAAGCMEQACREIEPGMSELEVGARLLRRLYPLDIKAAVLLVGADERVSKFRHPVATAKKIDKYVMMSVCAERGGLIVPTTRLVHFGPVPQELQRRYSALRKVAASMNLSSKPGTTIGSVLAEAIRTYEEIGFAEEWKGQYPGGVCGYAAREVNALPGATFSLAVNQVLGWNPTITGTKIEDAYVIEKGRLRSITMTSSWPSSQEKVAQGSITLPDILML